MVFLPVFKVLIYILSFVRQQSSVKPRTLLFLRERKIKVINAALTTAEDAWGATPKGSLNMLADDVIGRLSIGHEGCDVTASDDLK